MKPSQLKPLLDGFVEARSWAQRIAADPVEFPHRYRNPRDVEVVALLSASLAYGRASLFKPKIEFILGHLGRSPAKALAGLTVGDAREMLHGFVYRFNVPADVAVLLLGMGRQLGVHGSLERAFTSGMSEGWQSALAQFAYGIRRAAPENEIIRKLGPLRGLHHLLPFAQAGAAKRLNLYLRWMVRGPDEIDFGIWKQLSPSQLIIPLDTHVMRIARRLGLTKRNTISWQTAEEITTALRALDAEDPVRYDFALCHYGMSGVCAVVPVKSNCRQCELKRACAVGRANSL